MTATEGGPLPAGADAGAEHRIYTRGFLRIYDLVVLTVYGGLVWRCPRRRLVEHYRRHIGRRHLDVGPGTGYFLHRLDLPEGAQVTLLDPNDAVLAHASRRLRGLAPVAVRGDVCQPLPVEGPFDSVAFNYLLHCLAGPRERKAAAIRHAAEVLTPDGVLFGATIPGGDRRLHGRLARGALRGLNRRGIFDNLDDTEANLREDLAECFHDVVVEPVGSAAVFSARRPRRPARRADG